MPLCFKTLFNNRKSYAECQDYLPTMFVEDRTVASTSSLVEVCLLPVLDVSRPGSRPLTLNHAHKLTLE